MYICTTNHILHPILNNLSLPHVIDLRYLCLASALLEMQIRNIDGDIAELGVFRGDFAKYIHALCPKRNLYLLDTFSGFDKEQFNYDKNKYNLRGPSSNGNRFDNTSVDIVLKNISGNKNFIHPIVGFFPNSSEQIKNKKFAFVSLDADLYEVMRDGIEFFYPRLTPGGYIMIHDFNNPNYPGTQEAIYTYLVKNHIPYIPIPDNQGSIIISKPI